MRVLRGGGRRVVALAPTPSWAITMGRVRGHELRALQIVDDVLVERDCGCPVVVGKASTSAIVYSPLFRLVLETITFAPSVTHGANPP